MKGTQRLLLFCGVLAPLIYVGSDVFASLLWESHSYTPQSVSDGYMLWMAMLATVLLRAER